MAIVKKNDQTYSKVKWTHLGVDGRYVVGCSRGTKSPLSLQVKLIVMRNSLFQIVN